METCDLKWHAGEGFECYVADSGTHYPEDSFVTAAHCVAEALHGRADPQNFNLPIMPGSIREFMDDVPPDRLADWMARYEHLTDEDRAVLTSWMDVGAPDLELTNG